MSNKPSEDAPVVVKVEWTKSQAEATESYSNRCIVCKDKVFFVRNDEALVQGHIYSEAGQSEYWISKMCEWCFDKVTAEPEYIDLELDDYTPTTQVPPYDV